MRGQVRRRTPLIGFWNAVALAMMMQVGPGCAPSLAPRMPPVPTKTVPPVNERAAGASAESRELKPIPTLVPSVPLVRVPSGNDLEQVNQTILTLQNTQRAENGKPALALDERLTRAAEVQARFCASNHQLTHQGTNNSTVGDRVSAQGFHWAAVAENAAMQEPAPQGWPGPDPRTAQWAVQGWMKSPGHRANLLGNYQQCGACYADAPDGTRYWVVTFGTAQTGR